MMIWSFKEVISYLMCYCALTIHIKYDINVYDELKAFDVSKACGPDGITQYLLKITAEFIAPSLSKLMNASLNSDVLPFDWLSANIVPIHNQNDKHLPENYRPISLTSVVVKVMERLVKIYHCLVATGCWWLVCCTRATFFCPLPILGFFQGIWLSAT